MGKLLILLGVTLVIAGLLVEFGPRVPLPGRLPGDIVVENKNFKFYFPIVTSIVISIVLSLLIYLVNKLKG
jgi:hypothetical protein